MAIKTPASKLRINDILFKIPPQSITILKNDYNTETSTLRAPTSTRVKSGRKDITIVINTVFANGYNPEIQSLEDGESWVNTQLAPLLIQTHKCPFVSIENEKIRKEILGEELAGKIGATAEQVKHINMAAIIRSITATVNAKEPGIFHTQIVMQYFNYTPYSPDFAYKDIASNGRSSSVETPGNLFDLFYKSGTMNGRNYLNAIDVKGSGDLEFYYKEYIRVAEGELEGLISQGWEVETDLEATTTTRNITVSRYKKFVIENSIEVKSGALILESGSISLQTKVPTIPLNGHVIPTAQFLGCSDGAITLSLFANAELDSNGKPSGTSKQLAKLNRVFEVLSRTAVDFHRVARNNVLLIKHPLARLLRYKRYDEAKNLAYNDDSKKFEAFDPNDCLGCILENTASQTVEGLPYCSRFTIQLTEDWRSLVPNIREENVGGTARAYEATQGMLIALADRYGIIKSPVGFYISKTPPDPIAADLNMGVFPESSASQSDYPMALKLVKYLNDSRYVKELDTAKDYITDDKFLKTKSGEFTLEDVGVDTTQIEIDPLSGASSADLVLATSKQPLSYDRMNELVTQIIKATYSNRTNESIYPEYSEHMREFSSINRVKDESTYPDMILPRDEGSKKYYQPDFFFYNQADTTYTKNYKTKLIPKVEKRLKYVTEQFNKQVGNKDASKEYNNDVLGSPGPPTAAPNIILNNSEGAWKKENSLNTDKQFAQDPLSEKQQIKALKTSMDNFEDITYSMRRAMPTFKLYFKENDFGSMSDLEKNRIISKRGIWRNFADFYDMNSIVDIRLAKDKENPADLLIVRMTNTKEDLVNKSYPNYRSPHEEAVPNFQKREPNNIKTVESTDLDATILKEGTRIELRLGHDVDPNKLSVEFSGRVARVGGGDVVEIVCQGDGIELLQELKGVGVASEYTFNSNTINIITKVLEESTEVKSFGTRGARTALGELDLIWNQAGGRTIVENIFAPSLFGSWDKFADKTIKYTTLGASIGILGGLPGILAGTAIGGAIGLAADVKDGLYTFFKGSKFVVYEQTLWDILQELTLRHPGTICGVAPFDRRSTLFFGYPDQLYFFRGPSFAEALQLEKGRSYSSLGLVELNMRESLERKLGVTNFNLSNASSRESILTKSGGDDESLIEASEDGMVQFMKPYRNYHFITSQHDIIENGIVVNSDGVYNSMQIVYPDTSNSKELNFDGSASFAEYDKTDEIKADDDLNLDYIKRQTLVYHNATKVPVEDLPERYGVSNLCRSLNNVYKGKIKILGRPKIKPYDIVFVYDSYNNISGPIEVKDVVHTISYSTGWVTEITPSMIVMPTTNNSYHQIKAMERMMKSLYLKNTKLFYAGAVVGPSGELINNIDKKNSFFEGKSGQLVDSATTGAAIAGSTVIAGNIASKLPTNLVNAKAALQTVAATTGAVQKVSALAPVLGRGVTFVAGRVFSVGVPVLGDLLIDYLVGAYVNWSKYRQPIIFVPVQRNGKPWYTALHGLQNNSEWDAIKGRGKELVKEGNFMLSYLQDEFAELF